ncbi:MAG: cysteine desulfurase family protein [Planctomycetota bacterium]|jgi:cysteine desulfurase
MIYLDNHATTAADPRVIEAMLPCLAGELANPGSTSHAPGRAAAAQVGIARARVAALIGATPAEIVFTSGATEANNLALIGIARQRGGGHIVTSAIEHPAVLETVAHLEAHGCTATILDADETGRIRPEDVQNAIGEETILVSVMAANNEIGTIEPIGEIGRICRERGVLFHTDASQAIGKTPLDVEADSIDLLSFTGHKLHGPMGCGALYVKTGIELSPLSFGGGQEGGRRAGTLNLPGIVGLGVACRILRDEGLGECARIAGLRDRLFDALTANLEGVVKNGPVAPRLPGNLHVSFLGVQSHELMAACPGLAVSAGAACHSDAVRISPVLAAIGCDAARAAGAIRFGLGRFTTEAEVDAAAEMVVEAVRRLKT